MTPNQINKPNSKPFDFYVSIDDAHDFNITLGQRLIDAGIVPTFFIETGHDDAERQIKALSAMGCEIGGHTVNHFGDIKMLPAMEVDTEFSVCKANIEEWTGKPCVSLAYPRGRYNDSIMAIAQNAGFTDARTTLVGHTKPSESPYRTHTTIHAFDGRKEYKGRSWQVMADFYLDHVLKNGGFFHLWGHSRELLRDNHVDNFVAYCKKIKALSS